MNLDTALLLSTMISLLIALVTTLWLGLSQYSVVRIEHRKEHERRSTEKYLRRNLGLES